VFDTFDPTACDGAIIRDWPGPGADESGGWRSIPGQQDHVIAVDSPSGPFVIVTAVMPNSLSRSSDQLYQLLSTVHIN
jgi:hypothetical protein